jgi:hypothetical protein
MKYYDGMGKDVSVDVLKWKQAFDAQQPQPKAAAQPVKVKAVKATATSKAKAVVVKETPKPVEDTFNPVAVGEDTNSGNF